MTTITEAEVETAALDWLRALGWQVAHGPDIAPGTPNAERDDYGQVVLERRLRDALAELNSSLPASALEDAFRRLTRPEGATLEARDRTFHRMLVDGVTVEHRTVKVAFVERRYRSSTSTAPPATTGWQSTSSPSPRTGTPAGRTSCSSSTGCH